MRSSNGNTALVKERLNAEKDSCILKQCASSNKYKLHGDPIGSLCVAAPVPETRNSKVSKI